MWGFYFSELVHSLPIFHQVANERLADKSSSAGNKDHLFTISVQNVNHSKSQPIIACRMQEFCEENVNLKFTQYLTKLLRQLTKDSYNILKSGVEYDIRYDDVFLPYNNKCITYGAQNANGTKLQSFTRTYRHDACYLGQEIGAHHL